MNWLWYGCFFASVVFIFLATKGVLFSSGKTAFRIVEVALYLAAATLLMYAPIFWLQQSPLTAILADFINIMRVVSLDAGYLDNTAFIQENIGTGTFYRLYMLILGMLHFAMPLISVLVLYRMLFRFYSNMLVRIVNLYRNRPMYVFNEINQGTVRLAGDIQKNIREASFIFGGASESDQKKEVENLANAILHPDSIQNIPLLKKGNRDVYYFFLSEDERTNMTGALDVIGSLVGKEEKLQKKVHVYIGSNSDEMVDLLDLAQKESVDVNLLKIEELAVYRLLEKHPLYKSAKNQLISVLVLGLDPMGIAVTKAVSWCGQLPGYRLKINVAGIGIEEEIENFKYDYPGLLENDCLELNFYNCTGSRELLHVIREHCQDTTYAVVTEGTDIQTAEVAVKLRREFLKVGGTFTNTPEIHAYIRNEDQEKVLEQVHVSEETSDETFYGLDCFGSDEQTYTWKNVLDSDYELLAVNVHAAYERGIRGEAFQPEEAYARYNGMELNKRASKANAMHIRYKLAVLGLDYVRESTEEEVDFTQYLSTDELEVLAKAEHNRWRMFLSSEGWTKAELSEVENYQKTGLNEDMYKCPLMKMHPFLCTFEEMEDRAAALGCMDKTGSDRELIKGIPDILHDSWGLTGIRYKIIRKK